MIDTINPKVSVVIPTYGGNKSILRAIDSVLRQTYSNFDVIVVDDNNPDSPARKKTEKNMLKYQGDNRVIYLKHERNKNGSAARNTGVKYSDAKYICLLDDDDVFLPDKIKKQVLYLEQHPEYEACYCWRKQYGKNICGEETGDLTKSLLDLSFTPTTSALMIQRTVYNELNGFDESYRRHQDFEFLIRFYRNYKIGVVKEILLEFIGNEVDNQVYGKKLYDLKVYFFEQFENEIDKLEQKYPGYKKEVYAVHFATASKQLIKKGNFGWFIKLYWNYGRYAGLLFWKKLMESFFITLKRKLRG